MNTIHSPSHAVMELQVEPLTREAFKPFGEVIMLQGAKHYPINQGTTERFHALAFADVAEGGGQAIISLFRGQARELPFRLQVMERHPLGSQAFIPMSHSVEEEYLVAVAPAGELDLSQLRVFLARGFQGVNYGKGVWHHPLLALHKTSDFIVVDRIGAGNNCDEIAMTSDYLISSEAVNKARARK